MLVEHGTRGTRITAVNGPAARAGAMIGQALKDARAIYPLLQVEQADPDADIKLLDRIAHWALRYSPIVMMDGNDGLLIDIEGCAHLFGGEARLIEDAITRLSRAGLTAHAALADTPGAAWALARFGAGAESGLISPIGESALTARLLGTPALRLDDDVVLLLSRLGLKSIGQLQDLPRATLERRFRSREVARSVQWRLDQLDGTIREPLRPLRPPAPFRVTMPCPEPALDTAAISFALNELLLRLQYRLEEAGQGGRHFHFICFHADGGSSDIAVRLSRPDRQAGRIARLFADRLEQIDPGYGIDAFVLAADDVAPMELPQKSLTQRSDTTFERDDDERLATLIDTLSNRLGTQNVTRLAPAASHLPERAWRNTAPVVQGNTVLWQDAHEAEPHAMPLNTAARPLRLFARPEAVDVIAEVPDGPPMRFTWRRVARAVIRARGPERVAPEWWVPGWKDNGQVSAQTRDYYEVEDREGRRYWLFRAGLYDDPPQDQPDWRPRWFVHGLF